MVPDFLCSNFFGSVVEGNPTPLVIGLVGSTGGKPVSWLALVALHLERSHFVMFPQHGMASAAVLACVVVMLGSR